MRDRRERFLALAEARTSKALNAIRLIGNLSNKSNYEYTEDEVNQILKALKTELKNLESSFTNAESGNDTSFKLKT